MKTYITLNTLATDAELPELYDTLALIAESGADAVIVQDAAVITAVKKCCPTLRLHASTQMAVHNVAGARLLAAQGFSRIVLARELSVPEIKAIADAVDCEIEVFVHGAHCMSASGMCYLSSAFGARSGNRGLCAQPCRLNFKAGDREYALSLKDMCLAGRLDELRDAGVASLKIEGRMKRPEYVAAAVTAYRQALAGETPDIETLKSVFSRSGFTDGYAAGKRTLDMFGARTKDDVIAASAVLPKLKNLYKDEYKSVAVDMTFRAAAGEPCSLTLTDGAHTVTAAGDVPETALKTAMTPEMAEKALRKLGGTFYEAGTVDCEIGEGIILPAASVNALRRDACEKLTAVRGGPKPHPFVLPERRVRASAERPEKPALRLSFRTAEQIPEGTGCERILLPLREVTDGLIARYGETLCARIPALVYPGYEDRVAKRLAALAAKGLRYALCDNIGAIAMAKAAGLTPLGGALLNVMNSEALAFYRGLGVADMTLSPELSFEHMRRLSFGGRIGFIGYGHMPLMHFRCCPMQGENGCGRCTGVRTLTDRRGDPFPVLCEAKRFSVLYNPVPLYVGDRPLPPTDFATLCFTTETRERCAEIARLFAAGKPLPGKRTAGLYDKVLL
ncbi:MAG: U32 family peptidase [Clostridia bacterium]|nr:U32 family peptidase [Clostridia bacterium]